MGDTKVNSFRFSGDPRCLLRIKHGRNAWPVVLADGTIVGPGEAVLTMHLWNEHLPARSDALAPGLALLRDGETTLRQLVRFLESRPDLDQVRAIHGEIGFLSDARLPQAQRIASRLGFQLVPGERPGWNPLRRSFWRNVESWRLLRRFNPESLERSGFGHLRRCEAWMSREYLRAEYGAPAAQMSQDSLVLDELPVLHRPAAMQPALAGAGD